MSQFELHSVVRGLIRDVGSSASPERLIEIVEADAKTTSAVALKVVSKKTISDLAKKSKEPEKFVAKYEELKAKDIDCLGSYMQLMDLISKDKVLLEALERNERQHSSSDVRPAHSTPISLSGTESKTSNQYTSDDVPKIRSRLSKAVTDIQQKMSPNKQEHEERKVSPPTYCGAGISPVTVLQPRINLDFSEGPTQPSFSACLGPIPISSQESYLLEDLLCCLEGIEGQYITPKPLDSEYAHRSFDVSPSIDPSLRQLVEQVLQLASSYSLVARFVEEKSMFVWGQVNQALAAAMNALLRDYFVLVAQLETLVRQGGFTLHKMWFYIQPTLLSMKILADTANRINMAQAKGGKVLSLLHEQTSNYIGDGKGQDLCYYLIQAASVPYMEILEKWICKGVICDPYGEFLVEDNEVIQKEDMPPVDYSADYWEKRYTIRKERIPVFLDVVSKSILRTGKYLNVIRQCGKNLKMPQDLSIVYTIKERRYIEAINSAYLFASKALLQLLMEENDLLGRLRSVKHYFLLDQGDFIVQFMDCCEAELCQNVDSVQPNRLAALLELALRTSCANSDPYKDDMRTELLPYDLKVQMFKILSIETANESEYKKHTDQSNLSGMKFFSFAYEVKWPVSLVLNRKAISCYQMIFRHLFYCKHVERLLCRVWISNKIGKTFQKNNAKMYVPAFALRQRMLTCIQNLEYYMMVEVIEPNWLAFLDKISKVNNVDDVLVCHSDFLDSCLKDCMLMTAELLDTVNALLALCEQFCKFMQRATKYFVDAELTSMIGSFDMGWGVFSPESPEPSLNDCISENGDSFEKNIKLFDDEFSNVLINLLNEISNVGRDHSSEKLVYVLYRLNLNDFYTDKLEKFSAEKSVIHHDERSG